MGTRRNPRRAAANTSSLAEDDGGSVNPASSSTSASEESSGDESLDNALIVKRHKSTRTSSRSTRYKNSMQEPRDSIRDLLDGRSEFTPSRKKSPAKRHSSARRRVRTEVPVDSDSSSSEEEEESDEEEDEQEELKIQRIVASRSEPRRVWKELTKKMNTSEIEYGSRWTQENKDDDDDTFEERFLVKWTDLSYMHCSWETQQDLVDQVDGAKTYLTTFFRKSENGLLFTADERCDGDYFDPAFVQIDRILEVYLPDGGKQESKKSRKDDDPIEEYGIVLDRDDPNFDSGTGRQLLIKWKNTPYSNLSYEFERDLILNEIEYMDDLKALEKRSKKPTKSEFNKDRKVGEAEMGRLAELFQDDDAEEVANVEAYQKELAEYVFPNGGQLRDYQAVGVTWLASNYIFDRSSILCDEMGLGKTLQTAAFIDLLAKKMHRRGPYLIVAPLSTIPHWQREFNNWTDLNTIVYHGSAKDRELIREHEIAFECDRPKNVGLAQSYLRKCMPKSRKQHERTWMAQVVITTPEMLVTDDFVELTHVKWEVLVVDEAHRLKNHNSRLATNLRDRRFDFGYTLLLTGTPIQNNMTELWTLLNFVDPEEFGDMDAFLEEYGDMKSKEHVDELHERIRPYILRRLKEDVEKSVPPKEETLIEVELTVLQKQYYRALYEKNVQFLHKNKKKGLDLPSLNNLAMQLRKCCNHPFLLNGVEEDIRAQEERSSEKMSEGDFLVRASGKLVLLDKLLPRLRDDGHRVLIFSQFKIMLDILEDYLTARDMKFERIDGSITGNKRQMAIDRFQSPPVDGREAPLVMLLSTRAGGVGINLTAADTCIIFDSDWNPQNDLQAQARCHRIGQTKNVKVYRLLSRKTYEMQMFHMSSLKMGLDQAVLQGFENSGTSGEGAMTKEEVERLLRHGAYDIFNEEKNGSADAESNDFVQQDIDSILERRSKTVIHDQTGSNSNAAGGTFSKASFKAPKMPASGQGKADDIDIDDPEFWKKMVGEAKVDADDLIASGKKRKRSEALYSETAYDKKLDGTLFLSGSDSLDDSDSDSDEWSVQDAGSESQSPASSDKSAEGGSGQAAKKLVKKKKERAKWGGSKLNQWDKKDATKLLKALQMYGYGNFAWDEFVAKASIDMTNLDIEEAKRMSWAMLLFLIREAAEEDALNAKRRAQRKAEKELNANGAEVADAVATEGGGVLGSNLDELAERSDLGDQLVVSFKRLVDANASWLSKVFQDATEYANSHPYRSKNAFERAVHSHNSAEVNNVKQSLPSLFVANLWPSLKSRGWAAEVTVEGEFAGTTCYVHEGNEYRSPHAVLDAVPGIHPELTKIVENILSSAGCTPDWKDNEMLEAKNLDCLTCSPSSLSAFLDMYAPLQLLVDRQKRDKISMHRKVLGTCSALLTAHSLVDQASSVAGPSSVTDKLANGLSLNKQIAKPHPSWTTRHDAVLINAIAKHGWIDQESCCRAIINDGTIKWGEPFDDGGFSDQKKAAKPVASNGVPNLDLLRDAARQASDFLNAEQDMIAEVKGFNQDAVVQTFGLVKSTDDADSSLSPSESKWIVDEKLLLHNADSQNAVPGSDADDDAGGMDVEVDLPPKKELLKRAKTVLSRASFTYSLEHASVAVAAATSTTLPNHEFSALDQTNPCNLLLAEMLRGMLKMSFSKSSAAKKNAKLLCSNAQMEARRLCEGSKRCNGEDDTQTKELEKIANHIRLVGRTMTASPRQAKNVLRVVLGEPLVMPKNNPLEPIFPFVGMLELQMSVKKPVGIALTDGTQKKPASAPRNEPPTGKPASAPTRKKSKDEPPTGNKALSRAIVKGFEKNKESNGKFSEVADPTVLELTASETLILTVLCNQGLPVWNEKHVMALFSNSEASDDLELNVPGMDSVILWTGVATVFRNVAETWASEVDAKLSRYRSMTVTESNKEKRLADIKEVEREANAKRKALKTAHDDVANPLKFAKKCLLLLQAVRQRMGHVDIKAPHTEKQKKNFSKSEHWLGPFVLDWLVKDMARWSHSLQIVDAYNQPLSSTAAGAARNGESDCTLFAIMNKQHCRAIFTQIAQLTRARSIFMMRGSEEMRSIVAKASRESRQIGDDCDEKPAWWNSSANDSSIHDFDLLDGLLRTGYMDYKDIFSSTDSFRRGKENHLLQSDAEVDEDDVYTPSKNFVQTRVNQLTRELHGIEGRAESLRYVEKKARLSGGSVSVLISSGVDSKPKAASGRNTQTDIQSFFSLAKPKKPAAASKKRNSHVFDLCGSDPEEIVPSKHTSSGSSESEVEVVAPSLMQAVVKSPNYERVSSPKQDTAAKRKESPSGNEAEADGSPQKKAKVV